MQVATQAESRSAPRIPLSRQRVLRAAVKVADQGGIESLTMRRLAEELEAEAMSLYYHVANKEDVLDGIVDVIAREINDVVDQIDAPSAGPKWKTAVRRRILSARQVLLQHPWAPVLFEKRASTSQAVLRYYDGLLGLLRDGGFSYDLGHHALHVLGSRALGFAQELIDPGNAAGGDEVTAVLDNMADQFPHLVGMLMEVAHDDPGSTLGWCDDQTEFEFALDLILDGLDRTRQATSPRLFVAGGFRAGDPVQHGEGGGDDPQGGGQPREHDEVVLGSRRPERVAELCADEQPGGQEPQPG
jgi:AcrR family transcriptional regulator